MAASSLQGDIGLKVQLGASAALGLEANGKYAFVLAREFAAPGNNPFNTTFGVVSTTTSTLNRFYEFQGRIRF